jgi:putative tricarboxylic transport membrane protein
MGSEPVPEPSGPRKIDIGETLLALVTILFGAAIVWQTTQIRLTPAYSKVGPRTIPYIVGAGLILIGLWLAFEALSGRGAVIGSSDSEDADPSLPTDWRTIGILALALLAYLVLLEPAGFVVASTVLFAGAAFAMGSRRYARDIVIGALMAAALYLGFTRGLGLDLPAGILAGIL